MIHKTAGLYLATWLALSVPAGAATAPTVPVELPAAEYPFNFTGDDALPSMQQSLQFSKGLYQMAHNGLQRWLANKPTAARLSVLTFDFMSTWLPLGNAWLHEEWHRAVLTNRGIASYNEIYDWNFFSEVIAVSHVADQDLIRLKRDYPADLVRLGAAGLEAQYELNLEVEKDRFFYGATTWNDYLLWVNYLNSIFYLHTCASDESNRITDEENGTATDMASRDFTGLDCNAWVYDLFRPDEPYEARGIHPSGDGVDRYRSISDLSTEEKAYLRKQRTLSLINLLDPFLFGGNGFRATNPLDGAPFVWNLTGRHHLTSFGYTVDLNLFLKQYDRNLLLVWHHYFNHARYFPGLELGLYRYRFPLANRPVRATMRAAAWLQPRGQEFYTEAAAPGGLVAVKLGFPANRHMEMFVEVEAKTAGWVAGNVYLDENVSTRVGVTLLAF